MHIFFFKYSHNNKVQEGIGGVIWRENDGGGGGIRKKRKGLKKKAKKIVI